LVLVVLGLVLLLGVAIAALGLQRYRSKCEKVAMRIMLKSKVQAAYDLGLSEGRIEVSSGRPPEGPPNSLLCLD